MPNKRKAGKTLISGWYAKPLKHKVVKLTTEANITTTAFIEANLTTTLLNKGHMTETEAVKLAQQDDITAMALQYMKEEGALGDYPQLARLADQLQHRVNWRPAPAKLGSSKTGVTKYPPPPKRARGRSR